MLPSHTVKTKNILTFPGPEPSLDVCVRPLKCSRYQSLGRWRDDARDASGPTSVETHSDVFPHLSR